MITRACFSCFINHHECERQACERTPLKKRSFYVHHDDSDAEEHCTHQGGEAGRKEVKAKKGTGKEMAGIGWCRGACAVTGTSDKDDDVSLKNADAGRLQS